MRPQETIQKQHCYYFLIIPIGNHIRIGMNARTTKVKANCTPEKLGDLLSIYM